MPKKRAQRRATRGEDATVGEQEQGPALPQQHRQANESAPNDLEGSEAHMPRRDGYAGLGMSHDAEAPGQVNRQLEEAEPAASGLFNWLGSPAASLGSPSLFASPHKIPLFQRSPMRAGAPGSPTNQFSVNSFANMFQSPLRTPMGDALHAALGSRFDTPCSAQFADGLFSPSPRRSSRLAASGRGAATDGLYGDMAAWDMGNGSAQQARAGGTGAGEAVIDALADAQQDDGTDLLQKLLRSPAAMDASDRPHTRSRGTGAGPSRLGGASARRRCLDFSRTDGPASLPLTRSSSPGVGGTGHVPSSSAAADPFLRSAAPHRSDEQAASQFITIPVPGGTPVAVGVEGVQAATLLPIQPLWGNGIALQPSSEGAVQPVQPLQMLMVPQSEAAAAMQLFMPMASTADAGEQPMSMQALLNGPSPIEGRARSRGRALRKLIEEDDEQQQQQQQQKQEQEQEREAEEAIAPGSGASDVRRSTRRTRRTAAAAGQEDAAAEEPMPAPAPAAPAALKGVMASIVQQAVANTPAGRRRQAAAAQAATSGPTAAEVAGAGSVEQQQRSSPAEQSALLSSEAHGLLPPNYRLQLLSGDSQASIIPPMTPDELQRQQSQVTARTCHCKKSRCLKLYCECFANGMFCTNCSCVDCQNTKVNAGEVMTRRQSIKQRDPGAFEHKLRSNNSSRKGCNCRKSHCLKKYCECFQLGVRCGDLCKCADCKNNEVEGSLAQDSGSRQQHPVGWHVPPGTSVGTPPMVRSMSRTASEPMGTPQTHGAVGVAPMLMRMAGLPQTPASNGPLVLLSLSSPFDAASLAARQHPQLPPNNSTPEMHPPDHFAADHTPNSSRRSAPVAALQLGMTANAVQQQLLAAAPKLQQLQQGMEQQGSGSPSHGGSMDGTVSGGPATTSAPVALRTRHRLSAVSSHSTVAVKTEPGMEAHGDQGQWGSQANTPRGGRLQQLQQIAEPEHEHETEADTERQRSRSRSMSRASTPTSSQLMPPPPRQHVPHAHHNTQAAPAAMAAMQPASGAAAGGERIICLGADGPLLKLPAAAFAAAPAVQLLTGGVAGVAVGQQQGQQQQGQQQQQARDQADPNSQVGVLIYLQDDTGKVSAYYVPTVATQDGQMLGGACLPGGVAVMQAAAVPVAMDGSVTSQPVQQQQQQQYLEQQPQQQLQQQQPQQQQRPHLEDIDVDLEADESLQHDDSEDMQQASPPRRVTRHAAAVAAAASSAKAWPIKRSTPTKRKAAGAGDDQDVQREQDTPRASPLKFARSPAGANGMVRTQLFRGAGPPASPASPTGMLLRNRALTKDDSPPGVADAMSPTKFLASPSSGRGSTMIRFSPGSTFLSPNSKSSRR